MITVACVLRSGGLYTPEWVERLQRQVDRHLHGHRFVCLSDVDVPCERIPLEHDWPGWWSKIELFRPGVFQDRVLFLDLDTLVVADLSPLEHWDGAFGMLADFYKPARGASGIMAWTPNERTERIYEGFAGNPYAVMHRHQSAGDQGWIWECVGPDVTFLQNVVPGMIGSFKANQLQDGPAYYSVVCFHGEPKVTDLAPNHWAVEAWG